MAARSRALAVLFVSLLTLTPVGATAQIVIAPPTPCNLDPSQPQCREPVLIVPGIVASHNGKCILKDRCAPGVGTWGYTPTAGKWYQPLIDRLEDEGYEEGIDLFVVFYDWRQTNLESATEYLVPAIDVALADSEADKVDIVAHSMGGLVARAYAQSDTQYRDDIDDLVLVGTPNQGAADAYTVRESGEFPDRWNFASQQWILRINRSLRKVRSIEDRPPKSFRAFFPSLKDLIPIGDFVERAGVSLAMNQLNDDAQNSFLEMLEATKGRLAAEGINVTTIAGPNLTPLATVPVGAVANRTQDDIDLARWRDGHATPDPPVAEAITGDQTVLASSVHALGGTQHDLPNTPHEELPTAAQGEILAAVADGEGPIADFIPSTLASASLGVDILSPADPVLVGPNGEVLSADMNTFPDAVFDHDPEDPDAPRLLTVIDPPPGTYTATLTGTDNGDYDLAVTYATSQEVIEEEADDQTTTNEEHVYTFAVGGQREVDDLNLQRLSTDPAELLQRIIDRAYEERESGLLRGYERANLTRPARNALRKLNRYEYHLERGRTRHAATQLRAFHRQLDRLERDLARKLGPREEANDFVSEIQGLLDQIRLNAPRLEVRERR